MELLLLVFELDMKNIAESIGISTYAEHTVQPYSLRSLLDATIRLHNQRLGHAYSPPDAPESV